MDKEESAGEGLFSLKPVGCFWKAFFLVDFGNPPVDAKKIRPNAYSKKRSTRVLARGWEMQGPGGHVNGHVQPPGRMRTRDGRMARAHVTARHDPRPAPGENFVDAVSGV